jgi:DHA1 family bicyclomycin/chloramphenicol resistance-like MFS transporter
VTSRGPRLSADSLGFILLCGALTAFPAFSIDMSMPAFPAMGASLGTPTARMALTLPTFFAGFATAPLVCGPLSDQVGRRPVLLTSTVGYALTSLGCALSSSLPTLLFWRVLQGMTAGAASALALSLVRDSHSGTRARTLLSYIAVTRMVAPIVAPSLGALVLAVASWRWTYGIMALGGACLALAVGVGLEEGTPQPARSAGAHPFSAILPGYRALLRQPTFVGYTMVIALAYGSHLAYVTGSSLVMLNLFHLRPATYALLFGAAASALMAAAFVSGRLNSRGVSGTRLILAGTSIGTFSAISVSALVLSPAASAGTLTPLLTLSCFAFGLAQPNAQQAALEALPRSAGAASALMSTVAMTAGAVASFAVEHLFPNSGALAMTGVMVLCSAGALMAFGVTRRLEASHPL